MITADMDCPTCGILTAAQRLSRDYTEDGVVEVWECVDCGFREAL